LFDSDNNERAWAQGIPAKMDSSFTLALWAKPDSAHEGFANLIGRTKDSPAEWHDGAKAFILAADGVWFQLKGYPAVKTTTSLWDDQWHHVAATYDTNDNSVKIYVDGVQEAVGTMDLTAWTEDISWYYWLSNGSGGNFSGEMKDVRIYDETLSETEIKDLHQPNRLIAWYPLDDDPGTSGLVDHSGNGYNGGKFDPNYTGESLLFDSDNNDRAWVQGIPAKMDSSFTLALWAKPDSAHEGFANLIGRTIDTAATWHDDAKAFLLSSDEVWLQCKGQATLKASTGSLWDDQWHHLAATYDTNDNSARIYVDGVEEAVGTRNFAAATEAADWYYWLSNGSGGNFSGEMKDVRIYDETLSETGISALAVPEPATMALLGLGGTLFIRRKK
jgi:hypothetical protein